MIEDLINTDASHIARAVFTREDVYKLEQQHIFTKSWLFLTHESLIPNSGDFVLAYMGEVPVIVSRDEQQAIHVSVNSCSHRGLPVCRTDNGNTKRFVCPYHNWSYGINGDLLAVPQERQVCQKPDKSQLGLKKIQRVASYRGLVFASLNEEIEPLEAYLGDMRWYLDCMFDRYPGGVEVIGAAHKWRIKANWKLPVENQLGDVGHGAFLHGALVKGTQQAKDLETYGLNVVPEPGHGVSVVLMPEGAAVEKIMWGTDGMANMDPEVNDYLIDSHKRVAERLGKIRARLRPMCFSIYPNFSFLWPNNTIRVSHPRAPGMLEYWSWWLVEKDAPDSIKRKLQENYTFFFGPGGVLEQEDSEAWTQQFKGNNIPALQNEYLYYGLGLGEEGSHKDLPGKVGSCFNEHYARAFYLRWKNDLIAGQKK